MQCCSLQRWTLLLSAVTPTNGWCFCFGSIPAFSLELFLHWSPVAYRAPTDLGSSSFSVLSFAFSYCSRGSQDKNTEVVCHSLLQGTTLCRTSPPWPVRLGWPHTAGLSFTELDKAVVLGSDWLVFCDYGFRVTALWCPLATPTVSVGFLWPWTWAISSRLLQQSAAAALTLVEGWPLSTALILPCAAAPVTCINAASLHMLICHLCILFVEVSVMVFDPLFIWATCFLIVEI